MHHQYPLLHISVRCHVAKSTQASAQSDRLPSGPQCTTARPTLTLPQAGRTIPPRQLVQGYYSEHTGIDVSSQDCLIDIEERDENPSNNPPNLTMHSPTNPPPQILRSAHLYHLYF